MTRAGYAHPPSGGIEYPETWIALTGIGGAPPTRLGRQSPRRGDVFRPLATISPVARDSRLQSRPIGDDDVTLRSIPARNPWQVASSRPLVSLCGLSAAAAGAAGRNLRGRQVALQRPARRRGLRLPRPLPTSVARNGQPGGASESRCSCGRRATSTTRSSFWTRRCHRRLSPTCCGSSPTPSSTPGSASSCVRGPCTSTAASGSTRRWLRSRWPRSEPAVLFGAVVESTGGSPLTAAMNLAYPLADALLLGLVVAVLAITGWRLDRAWLCILGSTAALALADSGVLYQAAAGSGDSIKLLDAGWPLAMLLLAAASWQPAGRLGARVRAEGATRPGAARGLRTDLARDPRLRTVPAAEQACSHPCRDLDARRDRPDGLHLPREDAAARDDPDRSADGRAHGRGQQTQADDRPGRLTRCPHDSRPDASRSRRVQGLQRHLRPSGRRRAPREDCGEAERSRGG